MRLKLLGIVLLLVVIANGIRSQTKTMLRGMVRDSISHELLIGATISLKTYPGYIPFEAISQGKGGFRFTNLKPINYLIITSCSGFRGDTVLLNLDKLRKLDTVIFIDLQRFEEILMPMTVRKKKPSISVDKDTLGFYLDAYPIQQYATIEDALRILPGVETDQNGNFLFQGKKIDRVNIDGKEVFLSNISDLLQNIPADMVFKIETYNSETSQGLLSGSQSLPPGKTLNIKLKNNKKVGYEGKVYSGMGNSGAFSYGTSATYFGAKESALLMFNSNNISNMFLGLDKPRLYVPSGQILETKSILDCKRNFGKSLIITGNVGIDNSFSTSVSNGIQNSFSGDSNLILNNSIENKRKQKAFDLLLRTEYKFGELQSALFQILRSKQTNSINNNDTQSLNISHSDLEGQVLSRSKAFASTNEEDNRHQTTVNLEFYQKFRNSKNRLCLALTGSSQYEKGTMVFHNSFSILDSLGGVDALIQQHQNSNKNIKSTSVGGYVGYASQFGKNNNLELYYRWTATESNLTRISYDFDSATQQFDIEDTLTTNQYQTTNKVNEFGFKIKENGQWRFQFQLIGQAIGIGNNFALAEHFERSFFNFSPRINLSTNIFTNTSCQFEYLGYALVPGIDLLNPLPDLSNPYVYKIGNSNIRDSYQHLLDLSFNRTSIGRTLQLRIRGGLETRPFSPETDILAGGLQQIQYINGKNSFGFYGNLIYGFPIIGLNSNGSIDIHKGYSEGMAFVNNSPIRNNANTTGTDIKLNLKVGSRFYLYTTHKINYVVTRYLSNQTQINRILSNEQTLDMESELVAGLKLSSFFALQAYTYQNGLPSQQSYRWNISVDKRIFKDHNGQIHFSIFDILNTANGLTQSVGLNYISTTRFNTLGRFWLVSFVWNFRKFGK